MTVGLKVPSEPNDVNKLAKNKAPEQPSHGIARGDVHTTSNADGGHQADRDPLAEHLEQLRREAEIAGDDAQADAITVTLRAHRRKLREAREAAEKTEAERNVIDLKGAKRDLKG